MPQTEGSSSTQLGWSVELRRSHLVFGPGSLARLGALASELGGGPILLVTDRGIRAAGWTERARRFLAEAGHSVEIFDGVEENPTEAHVAAGAVACKEADARLIVGLGGGSAMDCAKGVNFIATQGGRMEDYRGMGKASKPMLPSIGVPCTAGTGSEAQSFALISRDSDHTKMACGDEKARFSRVVLDPEVVATAPVEVMATTAIDALSHAVESMASTASNPMSKMFAQEAFKLINRRFEECFDAEPPSIEALGEMLLGAHFAGAAIETSMLGVAHALANPLTATFDVTHGAAVALVLPAVVRFNAAVAEPEYAKLLATGAGTTRSEVGGAGEVLARRIEELRRVAALPASLGDVGVELGDLRALSAAAAQQWTAGFNPREVSESSLADLYQACMELVAAGYLTGGVC